MTISQIDQNRFFPALTGIRAIAAYMVFCHHFNPVSKTFLNGFLFEFFQECHVGVTLFFVLSGFLITHRYYNQKTLHLKKYLLSRFARIYPIYFLLSTLTFLVFVLFYKQDFQSSLVLYFLNITLLKGYSANIIFSGIAQSWSLSVEEFFYFLVPLFFVFVRKSKVFLVALPFFFILLGFFLVQLFGENNFFGLMQTTDFMFDFTFFGRCTEFFVGMALAIFLKKIPVFRYCNYTIFGLLSVCFCIFWLSVLETKTGYGTDCLLGKTINTLFLPLFGIAPLYYGLITEKSLFSRLLSSKIFDVLGKSSYVFYLIHLGIFYLLADKFFKNTALNFIFLNIISVVIYRFLEAPLNLFFRKKFDIDHGS